MNMHNAYKNLRYEADPNSGCWLWLLQTNLSGYGVERVNYKLELAHRRAYEGAKGAIPVGMFVLHGCDTRSCVNPDHLRVGTHGDNMEDMKRRGRGRTGPQAGEHNPQARLTWSKVSRIRNLGDSLSKTDIGRRFGVSRRCVGLILDGHRWKQ